MPNTLPRAIGTRRRRLVLELPVDAPDGFGGTLRRHVAGPVLWGALEPVGAVARLRGGRDDSIATHRTPLRTRQIGSAPRRDRG